MEIQTQKIEKKRLPCFIANKSVLKASTYYDRL